MARINLHGLGIALVTPFRSDKSIDFDSLGRLLDYQLQNKTDYLVVLGTTAETPTLSLGEQEAVKRFVVEKVNGRVPLVLGCGGNNTAAITERLRNDDFSGFDAILSVTPYYNKPSQDGLYAHYSAVAEASPLPVILYNVPGRTGVNLQPDTTLRLANDLPNVIAIKEASGNIAQMNKIIMHKPDDFNVISGDDGVTFPLITLGAVGVISVIGNAFPREFGNMVRLALAGRYDEARVIHHSYTDLFALLTADGNPAGVKCVLSLMGMIENELRLPLVPTRASTRQSISEVLHSLGLNPKR